VSSPAELLAELVAIPSVTTEERAICDFLASWLVERGLPVRVDDRNLAVQVGGPGPVLLFSSHHDTVPVGSGWTVDPFAPMVHAGRMSGRGSNDAKASIAAFSCAMVALAADPPPRGSVVFAATCEEERGRNGLERFLPSLGPIDAAIVGEPTDLRPAVAQNGLLILDLVAKGRAGHAARPQLALNPIEIAARDIAALHALTWEPEDPHVGPMTLAVTQITAGSAHNVIPDECRFVVDIRTIPAIAPAEVVARVRAAVRSEVLVRSDRLAPARTPEGARILAAVHAAVPGATPFGSPTLSDWAHLKGIAAVKIGPGRSEVSHTADEWVEVAEVERAALVYERIAREYLSQP
jgi:acetylornithine deacetylase